MILFSNNSKNCIESKLLFFVSFMFKMRFCDNYGFILENVNLRNDMNEQEYVGFWVRVGVVLIDFILLFIVILLFMMVIYGMQYWISLNYFQGFWDVVVNYLFFVIVIIIFWIYCLVIFGKMMLKLIIVDVKIGGQLFKG